MILKAKNLLEHFTKKNCKEQIKKSLTFYKKELQKTNLKKFSVKKVIKRRSDKPYFKWKAFGNPFNIWIDKKDTAKLNKYFPEPKSFEVKVRVELDLFNYATRADLKNATGFDTSKFAEKTDLANLNFDVGKLDVDKLKNVSTNLSNLKSKVDKLILIN